MGHKYRSEGRAANDFVIDRAGSNLDFGSGSAGVKL